jgi:DNA-binding transcriptional MerR regulator
MTTERTHLSIGEVLSLLQPEFPDITISKIRFLESQGLLDPERTPSGYRKFHDDDIERLRWILTQQRDHFLPLKVIKDRLASGDLGSGTPEGVLPLAADGAEVTNLTTVPAWASTTPVPAAAATSESESVTAPAPAPVAAVAAAASSGGRSTGPEATDPPESTDPAPAGGPATSRPAASSKLPTNGGASEKAPAIAGNGTGRPSTAADPKPAPKPVPAAAAAGHDRAEAVGRLVEAPEGPKAEAVEETASDDAMPPTGTKGRRRHPTGHQPGAPTPEPGAEPDPEATVVVLTLDDLTERSGLSAREITELERYGLIAGETDGQVTTYDEEALVVARLAAGFNRYGIEPRHLRMYKVAAEREAGLFEQLISPLLKQRRPSARQQAVEMLEELAELADDLRAAMVRTALREYLGGS